MNLIRRLARVVKRRPPLYRAWRMLRALAGRVGLRMRGTSEAALRRHAAAALSAELSYAGEAAHLLHVLERCEIEAGTVVDIAAGDGVTQSCTLPLFRESRWGGLAVEADPHKAKRLERAYRPFTGVAVARERVTPANAVDLLHGHGIGPRFEVLNLDIDSYDLHVMAALLTEFRPAVITMEINEKVPPPVYFAVHWDPDHVWREDHFYGCSLTAAAELVLPHGYILESLHYNNAFFVREDVAHGRLVGQAVADAYASGYRDRPDRRDLFPWNHDVEHLLRLSPVEIVADLRKRFARYAGDFDLRVSAEYTGSASTKDVRAGTKEGGGTLREGVLNMEAKLTDGRREFATLGGGCFWCLEAVFEQLKGIERSVSGYAGGHVEHPTYREVTTGTTGHAEVVQLTFDPDVVSFREILEVFFTIHDPTTPNRQGADVGPQYRSIILWHSDAQRDTAQAVIAELERDGLWDAPIVTEVVPLETFYEAEGYHQEYYQRNPNQGYCRIVIAPKVAKFRKKYLERLRA